MSQQLPHDRQAEESVIGSVLIDPEMYYHVAAFLKPEDFYIHRNSWIWEAIGTLVAEKIAIDIITIASELEKKSRTDYGGTAYLTSLLTQVPTSLNAVSYGRIVKEHSSRRGLITHANEVATLAYSGKPISEVMSSAQASAVKATERNQGKRVSSKEAASQAIDAIITHPRFFTFGVSNLDDRLGGIFPERLYIWAGYQGTGKTAFEIQNARRNAEMGHKVMMISLEMSPAQMWLRMACGDLSIDLDSVLTGRVDDDTKSEVINLAGQLGDMYEDTISIYPAPMTLMDIVSAAKTERPDIMWIDHSNLISGKPKDMTLLDWAGYIPRFLRQDVAKLDNGISVHLLQQLNRGSNKENRRPNMHDIRLAGEDDPDMITLLYRPSVDPSLPPTLPLGQVELEMITDKNRFGWTGTENLIFNLPRQEFLPSFAKTLNPEQKRKAFKEYSKV
jgi:replicative DNA helicase